jgi:phosphinothricin acetyltransferase
MADTDIRIRPAVTDDAPALLEIYEPYVLYTTVTFEYVLPTVEEFKRRIYSTLQNYPYLVAERDGVILGYAYASRFRKRQAYDWTAECSIYVRDGYHRHGIGRHLYDELERILRLQNVASIGACISYPNKSSIKFHSSQDFERVARFNRSAYKLGQWVDVVWMQKLLTSGDEPPLPFIPYSELEKS